MVDLQGFTTDLVGGRFDGETVPYTGGSSIRLLVTGIDGTSFEEIYEIIDIDHARKKAVGCHVETIQG